MTEALAVRVHAASFRKFGLDGTYTPPGEDAVSVPVRVLESREAEIGQLPGGAAYAATAFIVEVRKSELASPVSKGMLVYSAGTFRVARVEEDRSGHLWCLILERQN